MWPRPWREMRAATAINWPRMVAPRALAPEAPARQPAARVRLWQMAARVSHAAFAGKCPEGRCARGPLTRSANTCSTMAWSRCCASAWMMLILSFRVSQGCDLRRPVVDSVADGTFAA
jgi:hypothetical protein